MGTNHYLKEPPCESCGRSEEGLHLGKSSAGWVYHLQGTHSYPMDCLEDWIRFILKKPEWEIYNEYGDRLSLEDWLSCVLHRRRRGPMVEMGGPPGDPGPDTPLMFNDESVHGRRHDPKNDPRYSISYEDFS